MNKEELDRNLIMLVERNAHLYKKETAGHKDKVLCNNTWASIGAKLEITSDDAIRRWKALRDRLSRLKRLKSDIPSGSSSAQAEEYSWPLYNALKFLLPHVKSRKSIGNFASTSSQRQTFEDSPAEDDTKCEDDVLSDSDNMNVEYLDDLAVKEFLLSEGRKKPLKNKIEPVASQSKRPHPVQSSSSTEAPTGKKKFNKSKATDVEGHVIQVLDSVRDSLNAKSEDRTNDVEWNFCVSLYASLKGMRKSKRRNLRFKVAELLHELESDDSN